jgi:fatty-acyl-CoA synthase
VHPDGYVEIRDRLKDVIISGGENILSVEVRRRAFATPGRAGGCDRRVSRMNAGGEAPHAFVVLKQGARADERELREFARRILAHFKAPHSVTFSKSFPKLQPAKFRNTF